MAYEARGRRRGGAATAATAHADTLRFPLAGASAGAEAVTFPLVVFGLHWLVVQLAATLAWLYGTPNRTVTFPYNTPPPPLGGLAGPLIEPLRQWDGFWYKLIAERGYGDPEQIARAAFWPLYPWLMRWGSALTGLSTDVVGYLIANAAFAGALVLLYRLVALDFDRAVARRTIVALAFFPTAFFFQALYTESLFLLLAVGALLAARQERWWWLAGLVGALAALTRSYGVLLGLPFAVLFFQQYRLEVRRWFPAALFAALPLLGPAIFGWHLDQVQNNWRAWADVQFQWDRSSVAPWETLRCAVVSCPPYYIDGADWTWLRTLLASPTWQTLTGRDLRLAAADSDTLELALTLLFFALAAIGLRRLPLYQSALVIPGLIIPLYQPSIVHALMSMPRFGLTLFPLFIVLALLFRSRWAAVPALALSVLLLVLLTIQFAHSYWVS